MAGSRRYSAEHVRVLVEEYQTFKAKVDTDIPGLNYLVQMADLDRALDDLIESYWEVVLLHGLLGMTLRAAAEILGVAFKTVARRYENALEELVTTMNGGIE